MPIPNESQLGLYFKSLLQRKFGDLFAWEKPQIEETVGPFDPTVFDGFEARRDDLLSKARMELRGFSDTEVAVLYEADMPDLEGKRAVWSAFLRDEIEDLTRRKPKWLEGGFGHPDYRADFEYWGKMENFERHEALMLSVGVEPKHFGEGRLSKAIETMATSAVYASVKFLVLRHEQFSRKFPSNSFGTPQISPSQLIQWFDEVFLAVHPDFTNVLRMRTRREKPQWATASQEVSSKTDRREVDKIAQLFTAMAIDSLGYDPKALRSPVPKEIADLAADMGLNVSDDTVRKYLKLGARYIPDDWKPKQALIG